MSDAKVNNNMEEQKMEAENKEMSIEKEINVYHNAVPELKNEKVNVCNSGTEVIQVDLDSNDEEIIECAEILVNLSKIKEKAVTECQSDTKDDVKKSAKAVVAKSKKKSGKGRKNNNRRNDRNNKSKPKEPTIIPMELIGKRTFIKSSVYDKINWSCYTKATRTLLMEVFPRKVLATHSLTGKGSPAFLDRAAKPCLNAKYIADIIQTVCTKCEVKENLVRHVITIKCADEAKMLRQREKKNLKITKTSHVEDISIYDQGKHTKQEDQKYLLDRKDQHCLPDLEDKEKKSDQDKFLNAFGLFRRKLESVSKQRSAQAANNV